jgi:hypothetical protein
MVAVAKMTAAKRIRQISKLEIILASLKKKYDLNTVEALNTVFETKIHICEMAIRDLKGESSSDPTADSGLSVLQASRRRFD